MSTNTVFIFPGQGSQSVGMLTELAKQYPVVETTLDQASQVLGYNLKRIIYEGPSEELNDTQVTQPAMLAADVAIWRVLEQCYALEPCYFAGHSLGEYSALVCSAALQFEAGIRLVAERGRLMQQAVPQGEGAMAAVIGLTESQVNTLCHEVCHSGEVLQPANFNAPGQIVIAGHQTAIDRAVTSAKNYGAKMAKPLAVSVPAHCELMRPAADHFSNILSEVPFKPPQIPILHNVDAESRSDPDDLRQILVAQLYSPVRWVDAIHKMRDNGAHIFIECGPGKVLTGLNKRIDKTLSTLPVHMPEHVHQLGELI